LTACWQGFGIDRPLAAPAPADLASWLQAQLGWDAADLSMQPLAGGCIHRAWCLQGQGGQRLFIKTNRASALPLLQAEAEGLVALAGMAAGIDQLSVPTPLALGRVGDWSVLVLPWLDLGGDQGWTQLGESLARLHRQSQMAHGGQGFGWQADNYIGSTIQLNGWLPDWGDFFAQRRLAPQLALLERSGQSMTGAQRLLALVPQWLAGHGAEPVLVHGDLWSGNAGVLRGGGASIFDPACHWADREVDLAMARLFGGFPQAFFSGYQQQWPLPPGAAARVPLYNLYHLLNHANLFGGGYAGQAEAVIKSLLARPPLD
jgi:fructosamine-3-kinase